MKGIVTVLKVSILSAIEGIETQAQGLSSYVVLITVVILIGFFMCQRFGTSKIGSSFGPIMVVWFVTLAIYGIIEVYSRFRNQMLLVTFKFPPLIFGPNFGLKFPYKKILNARIYLCFFLLDCEMARNFESIFTIIWLGIPLQGSNWNYSARHGCAVCDWCGSFVC
jgi:K+ potassium transporter